MISQSSKDGFRFRLAGLHERAVALKTRMNGTESLPFIEGQFSGRRRTITLEALLLFLFVGLCLVGFCTHEPWFDEAQAWLLVRDNSLMDLLFERLRYEGHPPLWYLLLYPLAKVGLPFASMRVLALGLAVLGVALLLFTRGLPLYMRALLPFGYFVAYQYSIVARSYALVFPLLILLFHAWRRTRSTWWPATWTLLALAWCSTYGTALACGLAITLLLESRSSECTVPRRARYLAATAFALGILVEVLLLLTPDNVTYAAPSLASPTQILALCVRVLGFSASDTPTLGYVVVAVLMTWFSTRGVLLSFVLSTLGLGAMASIYGNYWHEGFFTLNVTFHCLLATSRPERRLPVRVPGMAILAPLAFVLFLGQQVVWTWRAYVAEILWPYSGAPAAATYIQETLRPDESLFGAGFAVLGIQPYFAHNRFANHHVAGEGAWSDWGGPPARPIENDRAASRAWVAAQLAQRPDYFLVSKKSRLDRQHREDLAGSPGVQLVQVFPGKLLWKGEEAEDDSLLLYRVRGSEAAHEQDPSKTE